MSEKLPNLNYYDSTGQDYGFTKPYSDETANIIDSEVKRIINEQYERAKSILREYAEQHNRIRDLLVEREVIFHDDVKEILGPRKWKSRTDEIMEINKKNIDLGKKSDGNVGSNTDSDKPASGGDNDDDAGTPPPFRH